MNWLADYWWVILILLVGIIITAIKDMRKVNPKEFLKNKPKLPPHRDFNDKWDDEDDWPKKDDKK
ncbi:YpfN family protein [Proteus myxofaciens]|uniref:UPF0370 protein M983_0378 n=1 Tax=Proteus myxofaciens ATCC 19692 TaxID=1354337 RepID=A0A198GMK1_9GAMM|nr:YpfN family protein [Proteus myxofaciens]OAT37421.1 putative inner membrane protein [Proteus myxofaciens ATCC 19692]